MTDHTDYLIRESCITLITSTDFTIMQKLVSYFNNGSIPLSTAVNLPYTDIILAFLYTTSDDPLSLKLGGGIAASESPPALTKSTIEAITALHAAGKRVHISFGGGTMTNASYQAIVGSEAALAKALADFVKKYNLDGIDIDFEATAAFTSEFNNYGVLFLSDLTTALRAELADSRYLITHAPQPPYLEAGSGIDGYIQILRSSFTITIPGALILHRSSNLIRFIVNYRT